MAVPLKQPINTLMDTTMSIETGPQQEALAQLRLMQLISPSLPIGSFTYSQGIEWAADSGWIKNADNLAQWLREQLHTTLAKIDLPLLIRHYEACRNEDLKALSAWNDHLLAYRETSELRQEEHNRGRALASLLITLDIPQAQAWKSELSRSQSAGFSLAAQAWNIPVRDMLTGYAWSWLENLALAGVKIIPLGQSAGQQLLAQLTPELPIAIETALTLADDELGASNPALAIASSQHQFQYTRIFRS